MTGQLAAPVQRFNAAGKDGVFGILYQLKAIGDVDEFVQQIQNEKYAIVMPTVLLTPQNLERLQSTGKVAGIMLIRGNATAYSPDSTTPNLKYGLYENDSSAHKWNPNGLDLLSKEFKFPIFEVSSLSADNSTLALSRALEYNEQRDNREPLYGMQFMLPMWAAKSAEKCLERKYCEPISGQSVWSSFSDVTKETKPLIVVSAKVDSNALIRESSFGHAGRTAPLLVMAIANALSTTPLATLPKSLLFTFFTAEQWGFAGSQRFVQDISQGFVCKSQKRTDFCQFSGPNSCNDPCHYNTDFSKINLDQIDSIIEFDTVGSLYGDPSTQTTHYLHIDRSSDSVNTLVDTFRNSFSLPTSNGSPTVNASITPARDEGAGFGLPPSSAMSFLSRRRSIPAIVLSDYKSEFSNPFYNSEFDQKRDWASQHVSLLCGLANSTARSLYRLASGVAEVPASVNANCTLIDELFNCLTRDFSCPIMTSFLNRTQPSIENNYAYDQNHKRISELLYLFMANTTASQREGSCREGCKEGFICISNQCIKSTTRYHWSFGTGLEYDGYTGNFKVVDPSKPTWVESTWSASRVRIFKEASSSAQYIEIVVAIGIILLSGGAYYFWDKFV